MITMPLPQKVSKTCNRCHQIKDANDFYARYNFCKKCHYIHNTRRWRLEHPERSLEIARLSDKRRQYSETRAKSARAYRRRRYSIRKSDVAKYNAVWRLLNIEKHRAHDAVKTALRASRMVRPSKCLKCGNDKYIEAHHADYSKPLQVDWLCKRCHAKTHYDTNTLTH